MNGHDATGDHLRGSVCPRTTQTPPNPTQTIIHPEPTQAHHATSTTTAAAAAPDHRLLTAALELPCLLSRRDEYVGQLARAVAELGKVIN